ncbi:MAG: hypothetical protein JWM80_6277 [Cyanobacteria bacterium RYN_339]|nr:hypothetical protein [Cyanobacteria bacterium RYN_339]
MLTLPRLGFGCSPLGGVFGPVDEAESIRAVHRALELGITYFDTAPFYGLGRSETVLGQALAGVPRERYLVGSKVGRWGEAAFDFAAPRVVAGLEASLERLGLDRLDLVVVHDVEFGDLDRIARETLPALAKARDAGLVRWIGASGLPLVALRKLADHAPLDFVLSYAHYTLADTTLLADLPSYAARAIQVINASPLGMGLLTPEGPPGWHPAPAGLVQACGRAVAVAKKRGADPAEVALGFALAAPGVASTLVGMHTVAQVERNVAMLRKPRDLATEAAMRQAIGKWQGKSWPSGTWL